MRMIVMITMMLMNEYARGVRKKRRRVTKSLGRLTHRLSQGNGNIFARFTETNGTTGEKNVKTFRSSRERYRATWLSFEKCCPAQTRIGLAGGRSVGREGDRA